MTHTLPLKMPRTKKTGADLGNRLTQLRREQGLTHVQLAAALGATQRATSYFENECDGPPGPILIKRVLRVSTDELLGLKALGGPKFGNRAARETRRLWKRFRQVMTLPDKDRPAVNRLLNSLVQAQTARS